MNEERIVDRCEPEYVHARAQPADLPQEVVSAAVCSLIGSTPTSALTHDGDHHDLNFSS